MIGGDDDRTLAFAALVAHRVDEPGAVLQLWPSKRSGSSGPPPVRPGSVAADVGLPTALRVSRELQGAMCRPRSPRRESHIAARRSSWSARAPSQLGLKEDGAGGRRRRVRPLLTRLTEL